MTKSIIIASAVLAAMPSIAGDLQYDQKAADQAAILQSIEAEATVCMHDYEFMYLQMGERDSQKIVTRAVKACGGPLLAHLTKTMQWTNEAAAVYLLDMADDELRMIPGVTGNTPSVPSKPKPGISAEVAQSSTQPQRFPVTAGFVPIDDGSFHVVILTTDSVGASPVAKYCGANWRYGLIQSQDRSPMRNNAIITNPTGCWVASGANPETSSITFRYFDMSLGAVREFLIDPKRMTKFTYEWRTERLFPPTSER